MSIFTDILDFFTSQSSLLSAVFGIIIACVVFFILLRLLRRFLLKKVKTKKQISNVTVFLDLLKFLFIFFLFILIIALYFGNIGDLSLVAGLLSVVLGLALQRPISSVVAWLILVTRRPFDIGDRIIISNVKGDVTNITLTHIFLDEVGGTIEGEERSGRIIMVPTSIIFEHEIINYTQQDDYILVEITTMITYESDLDKAEELILTAVSTIMKAFWDDFPNRIEKKPHIRLQFRESGIDVNVRYYTIARRRNEIATNIRREIFHRIRETPDVQIAYPHTEVLFREKTKD
jgi:small-conductance mechanosensitive channel